jgi:hypothetical protein
MVDRVREADFDEVGSSQDNLLKQKEVCSPAIGQLRISGSVISLKLRKEKSAWVGCGRCGEEKLKAQGRKTRVERAAR